MELSHPPSQIIQQLLIDLGIGSAVSDDDEWPIYAGNMPDRPDDCIVVVDTDSLKHGRIQFTGETQEHPGFQVRVRTASPVEGYTKTARISRTFDEVLRDVVEIDGDTYTIQAITRRSGIIKMGKELTSNRYLWSLNCTLSISGPGTGS